MRQVIWLESAVNDVVRLRKFVAAKNPTAAQKIAQTLKKAAATLIEHPKTGKPVPDLPDYRELGVRFGAAGYVIRYRIHHNDVYIVHLRHYRESGFKGD